MNKILHYLVGVALIVYGGVLFSWFYTSFHEISYSINHIIDPMHFARMFSPIIAVYLGLFYVYSAFKNKINTSCKISLYTLVIGLLISVIIMFFTPINFGGTTPQYAKVLDSIWRILMPLSVLVSVIFSFISLFNRRRG